MRKIARSLRRGILKLFQVTGITWLSRKAVCAVLSLGNAKECNICGWTGSSFYKRRSTVRKPAPTLYCPNCSSRPRHRLALYFLKGSIGPHETTLHVAPEPIIDTWLKENSDEYLSIDLIEPAMRQMDLTQLELEDNTYSLVWCSHVLEHIPADTAAMSEMHRVLKPGGRALILVPIFGETTYEDPNITTPEERLLHYTQVDHVRSYGLDIRDKLRAAGFSVETLSVKNAKPEDVTRYELEYPLTGEIFVCTKT